MSLDKRGQMREGIDYNFVRREYGQAVMTAGGQPIFLDNTINPRVAAELCDGVIISGGDDIYPKIYGQKPASTFPYEPTERTLWERRLIEACDHAGVRVLGVCYGMQVLNVHYGGTLYQDIHKEQGTTMQHGSQTTSDMQRVTFAKDFLSFAKGDSVQTAHRHHQAVKQLGKGFTSIAKTDDGIVEAIAGHGHFGIQWHSESDGTAPDIYGAFVALCAGEPEIATASDLAPETT